MGEPELASWAPSSPSQGAENLPSLWTFPGLRALRFLPSSVLELGGCPPGPTSLGPPHKPKLQPYATCPLMGSL